MIRQRERRPVQIDQAFYSNSESKISFANFFISGCTSQEAKRKLLICGFNLTIYS